MRQLQNTFVSIPMGGQKFNTLADIGITSNAKTGTLNIDEAKVRKSLSEDYDSVAEIFIRSRKSMGVAEAMAQKLKNFRDPGFGIIKSRIRGLDHIIETQDKEIERRQRQLDASEKSIRHKFQNLESTLAEFKGQSDFLKARFGQQQDKN